LRDDRRGYQDLYWHKREVPTLTTNVGPLSEADYSRDLQPRL